VFSYIGIRIWTLPLKKTTGVRSPHPPGCAADESAVHDGMHLITTKMTLSLLRRTSFLLQFL